MKYIIKILLVFFVHLTVIGQTDTLSHKQYVDEYLKHLDKSKIPSGILLDRVLNMNALISYNGNLLDTTSFNRIYLGYAEL